MVTYPNKRLSLFIAVSAWQWGALCTSFHCYVLSSHCFVSCGEPHTVTDSAHAHYCSVYTRQ